MPRTDWYPNPEVITGITTTYDDGDVEYDDSAMYYDGYNPAEIRIDGSVPTDWTPA